MKVQSFLLLLVAATTVCANVIHLTDNDFDTEVHGPDSSETMWLIAFHAPWCGHCKRLRPVFEQASQQILEDQNKVIGDVVKLAMVNVESNEDLATRYDINSFPTLKFVKAGEMKEYNGGRSLQQILSFVDKMRQPPVLQLESLEEVQQTLENSNIIILLSLNTRDALEHVMANAFETVAKEFQDSTVFVSTVASEIWDSLPKSSSSYKIAKLELNEDPVIFNNELISNNEDKSEADATLSKWVNRNRNAIFPEISGLNFQSLIGSNRKLVMVCINDTTSDNTKTLLEQVKSVATSGDESTVSEFVFGYVDGIKFARFLQQYHVYKDLLPKVIVLDAGVDEFYETDERVAEWNASTVTTFLTDIVSGKEKPIVQGVMGWPYFLYRYAKRWYPYSILAIFPIIFMIYGMIKCMIMIMTDDDDPMFHDSQTMEGEESLQKSMGREAAAEEDEEVVDEDYEPSAKSSDKRKKKDQ